MDVFDDEGGGRRSSAIFLRKVKNIEEQLWSLFDDRGKRMLCLDYWEVAKYLGISSYPEYIASRFNRAARFLALNGYKKRLLAHIREATHLRFCFERVESKDEGDVPFAKLNLPSDLEFEEEAEKLGDTFRTKEGLEIPLKDLPDEWQTLIKNAAKGKRKQTAEAADTEKSEDTETEKSEDTETEKSEDTETESETASGN